MIGEYVVLFPYGVCEKRSEIVDDRGKSEC